MSWLAGIRVRFRQELRRAETDARMDEEIRLHIELETEKHIRDGVEPREARRRALVAFGGAEQHREALREGRRLPFLEDTWRDVRYAARSLGRTPGFAAAAILTLALGIAAPTLMFTVTNAVLLRPLPVPAPERLQRLQLLRGDGTVDGSTSLPEYQAYREWSGRVFTGLAAHRLTEVTLSTEAGAEVAPATDVSGNYFDVLGVRPALGTFPRGPRVERADVEPAVVISHAYWRGRLGGDSAVVGRALRVNGQPLTIVGVAPRGFDGAMLGARPAIWMPIGLVGRLQGIDPSDRGWTWLQLFGRLEPGVDRERAQAVMRGAARSIAAAEAHSAGQTPVDVRVSRFTAVPPRIERPVTAFTLLLLAAGTLVLLIATSNVAGMLLARGIGRRQEMAIRLAIGAGHGRLVRQLVTESVLMALLAGGLGVLGTLWASSRLAAIRPPAAAAFAVALPIDFRVLGFAAVVSVLSGILFGLTPALYAVRRDVAFSLSDGSPRVVRGSRLRGVLIVGQLAATLVLLVAAGLFVRTVRSALDVDHGFEPGGVLALELNLRLNGYDEDRGLIFYERLLERVLATPGVEAAAVGRMIPQGTGWGTRVVVPGYNAPADTAGHPVGFNSVSAGYFDVMRIPVLEGRGLRPEDASATPKPIVVNRMFARRFWPAGSAVGQAVRLGLEDAIIVGVVPTSERLGEQTQPYAYLPFGRGRYSYSGTMWLYARSNTETELPVDAIRRRIAELDPNVPPLTVATLEDILAGALFPQRTAATFIGAFGLVGLFLAASGLFALLSVSIAGRTREIGVRIALGASRGEIVRMVLLEAMRPLGAGIVIGLLAAAGAAQLLRGMLFGLSAIDPVTFIGVPLLLLAVALAAAWIPARRATRIDALTALRAD
ncbi:MAG: ADOP family duplicated permease [Longimicrobiales bacterium]